MLGMFVGLQKHGKASLEVEWHPSASTLET